MPSDASPEVRAAFDRVMLAVERVRQARQDAGDRAGHCPVVAAAEAELKAANDAVHALMGLNLPTRLHLG